MMRRPIPAWARKIEAVRVPDDACSTCPTCGRAKPKPQRRTLSPAMVSMVARLAALTEPGGAPVRLADLGIQLAGGDYARLPLWGLAESVRVAGARRGSGWWRITAEGARFVDSDATVPSTAVVLGDQVTWETGDVSFDDVLSRDPGVQAALLNWLDPPGSEDDE